MSRPKPPPRWKVLWYTFLDVFLTWFLGCFDNFLRAVGPVFVFFAVVLISGVVYSWFTFVLPVIAPPGSLLWTVYIVVAVWLTFNVYWNYISTIVTPAGAVPSDYEDPLPRDPESQLDMREEKHPDGFKRWCKKCRKPKPPRTHHCTVCRRCVLKMDHHCPWVCNCVGWRNYRTFFLFMAYLWVGCLYVMATAAPTFLKHILTRGPITKGHTYVVMSFILAFSVSIAVGMLLGWHVYLVVTAQTTIEWYGNRVRADEAKKQMRKFVNEWDVGWLENTAVVLGSAPDPFQVVWWFMPTLKPPLGDGTSFKVRSEAVQMQAVADAGGGE